MIHEQISFENIFDTVPLLNVDKKGNFIVTDMRNSKVSYYGQAGNLLFTYGREGRGPGDFLRPVSTIRLSSGQLLTAEFGGKISIFNAKGDSLQKIYKVELMPLTEMHELDDERILLVGKKMGKKEVTLLHIFDLAEGKITKSFLKSPFSVQDYGGVFSSLARLATVTVKEGKIAAMIVLSTKIDIYNYDAELLRTVELSLKHFRNVKKKQVTPREFDEFMTSFSMIGNIFWFKNDSFLISYYRYTEFERQNFSEIEHSLAHVLSHGTLKFEINDTPNLRAVHNDTLYFDDPEYENETDLLKGTLINN